MKFLRNLLATIVGLIIFSLLVFLTVVVIVSIASADKEVKITDNSVLHLKLDRPIIERESEDPFEELEVALGNSKGSIGLKELKEAIRHAKEDDQINGIYLEPRFVISGYAKLNEIRDALLDFKESGKFIYAYSEIYSEADYYLASVADEIILTPVGQLEFNGLSAEVVFLKGTLEKLDIEPQVFKVGDFKSAVEPFTRKEMSEPSRLQTNSFLNSIYDHYIAKIAASREIPAEKLMNISDSMLVRSPEDALKYKLITSLGYFDEVSSLVRTGLGLEEEEDISYVPLGKYLKSFDAHEYTQNRIAVIVANGNIVSGKGDKNAIGSDTFAEEIRKARLDDKIKAVVLRINSPGGSALASDVMWREVLLTSKVKPIIASMSDVAASGGYYMAMACDTIVAHPNTITGSIGIFGMLPNLQGFLENKLGVTTDVVNTGELSDIMTVTRPLTEFEKNIIQQSVEEGYEIFTRKAAEGRDMSLEALKEVASGRVWSGVQAKEKGLVDVLGGLEDAINIAVNAAGIEDEYSVNYFPKQMNFLEELLFEMEQGFHNKLMEKNLGVFYPYVKQLEEIKQYTGVQARMPFDVMIR